AATPSGRDCRVDLVGLRRRECGPRPRAGGMSAAIAVTGAGAVIKRSQEPRRLPPDSALVIGPDGSIPLGHLPEAVRGRAARAARVTQPALAAAGRALAAAGLDDDAHAPRAGLLAGTAV